MAGFDSEDIKYLAQTLTIPQLRAEVEIAERVGNCIRAWEGTEADYCDDFPWDDFVAACQEAITLQRNTTPKPVLKPGRVDLDAVRAHASIVDVIGQYTKLRKSGTRYTGLCPLHADKRTLSLVVYPEQQSWHCFGACGRGGDVIDFVMLAEHLDFKDAAARLAGC